MAKTTYANKPLRTTFDAFNDLKKEEAKICTSRFKILRYFRLLKVRKYLNALRVDIEHQAINMTY